jgi:hypothetical protein
MVGRALKSGGVEFDNLAKSGSKIHQREQRVT